jgi:hypothetical protein
MNANATMPGSILRGAIKPFQNWAGSRLVRTMFQPGHARMFSPINHADSAEQADEMPIFNGTTKSSRGRIVATRLVLIGLVTGSAAVAAAATHAAPGANWSRMVVADAPGESLSDPAPLQTEIAAGPWRMSVLEVATGDEATALVAGASSFNEVPADGFTSVAVKVKATNSGNQPDRVDQNDFGVVSSSGLVRRFVGAVAPDPALDATVAPGESTEGWIVGGAASDDAGLLLLYDSVTIAGNWADATLALSDGASLEPVDSHTVKTNKLGRDPSDPAGMETEVATSVWAVEILKVVRGADVIGLFPASDYRTTALLGDNPYDSPDSAGWIAVKVNVTNNQTGNEIGYLPVSAFTLADSNGDPIPDLSTLTAPSPEAAGAYYPGASREGWVLFDAVDYDGALVRFLPYRTDKDARYLTWDGESSASTDTTPSFSGTLAVGTKVATTEDEVRLRKEPSTDSDIIATLPKGTELTVTGAPQEGGGYTWYPVKNEKTGDTGFVAQQLIEPVQ